MPIINIPPLSEPMSDKSGPTRRSWSSWVSQVFRICFDVQNSGVTANRPTGDLYVGKFYFDTTLGKPIWYEGPGWVDATGAAV
jgi:hypothetical protein